MTESEKSKRPEKGWNEYGILVLKELERLNDNFESLRKDMDEKFKQINDKIVIINSIEKSVLETENWVEKVNDIWSPTQMKEAKDELYNQKNKWTATVAIFTFIQIIITILIALKGKIF